VIDVAAELEHPVPLPLEDGLALLRRHMRKMLVEIFRLVRLERLAVLILHQRHTEHVEPIAGARASRVENLRAGDIFVSFLGHISCSNRAASDCRPRASSAAPRSARISGSYRSRRRHRAYASSYWDAANPCPRARDRGSAR